MNEPYKNSENIKLSVTNMYDHSKEIHRFLNDSNDPAAALHKLLDYNDEFSFTIEECAQAFISKSLLHEFVLLAIKRHFYGATIVSPQCLAPTYDRKEMARRASSYNTVEKIDYQSINKSYSKIKAKLFKRNK